MTDPSLLRVANTPNTQFLLQPELSAIQQGLEYSEKAFNYEITYNGYVNKNGQFEGVGMRIRTNGDTDYGEYHLNNIHGCVKVEFKNGDSWWGEFKDGKGEGYGTFEWAGGNRYIG